MGFCHGNGDLARDGCCWVNGQICPLRLKQVDGRIYEGPDMVDVGTMQDVAAEYTNNPNIQDRVAALAQGVTYMCRAAVDAIGNDPSVLTDRAAFEAAWAAHPDYTAQVAPIWREVENRAGMAEGAMDCFNWTGGSGGGCCYSEDATTNADKAAGLDPEVRTLREGGAD